MQFTSLRLPDSNAPQKWFGQTIFKDSWESTSINRLWYSWNVIKTKDFEETIIMPTIVPAVAFDQGMNVRKEYESMY